MSSDKKILSGSTRRRCVIRADYVIQRARNCTYYEAVLFGREFCQLSPPTLVDEHARYVEQLHEQYISATHEALSSCPPALDALAKCGITREEVVKYRIGYHADDFDSFCREQLATLASATLLKIQ